MSLYILNYILHGEYAYEWYSELVGEVINGFNAGRVLT